MFGTPSIIRPNASVSVGVVGPKGSSLTGAARLPLATDGYDGDYFIALVAGAVQLYGPKVAGAWPNTYLSLVGPQGAPGPQILSGGGAPTGAIGNNNDYYIDTAASVLYGPKNTGAWPTPGTSLIGNQGLPGPANTLTIGSVTQLAPGATPTVTITGTAPNQSVSFGIPQGQPGANGTGSGTVIGPGTSTAGHLPTFADGTGQNLSDSGIAASSLAPLASPAFTGTPTTASTPAAADNSLKLATTAYADRAAATAASGVTAGSPSAYNSHALPYSAAAADKGTTINPTGTGVLSLPAATAVSGWYAWIKKRDDGGAATLTPASGTIDGLSSIVAYKEEFLVYYDAAASATAGAPVYRTQGRQRGWIDFGSFSVTTNPASIIISAGAGDSEIRDLELDVTGYVPSASSYPSLSYYQGGTAATMAGEYNNFVSTSDNNGGLSASSSAVAVGGSGGTGTTTAQAFRVTAKNINSTVAYGTHIVTEGWLLSSVHQNWLMVTSAGAFGSLQLAPSTGAITSMLYNVRLYRP